MDMRLLLEHLKWLGYNLGLLVGAVAAAFLIHLLLFAILRRIARRTAAPSDDLAVARLSAPTRIISLVVAFWLALALTTFSPDVELLLHHLAVVAFIVLVAWLLIRLLRIGRDLFLSHYILTSPDNMHARAVHTQIKVLERILIAVLILIALGSILMTFDGVRQLGASLLASAGILGIILGLAAQKVLGTLFAGLQLAISQPIRLEDSVVVEGESGNIEEITLTYVVVRLWDLRRLVVPMTYFMEKPFQNWSRSAPNLLGTVFLYVDPLTDVEPLRQELDRVVKAATAWDGKTASLQVTNLTERAAELRALLSAADSGQLFALRCHVREKLLEFLRTRHPEALVRLRVAGLPPTPDAPPANLPPSQ